MIDRSDGAPASAVEWPVYAVRHPIESNTTGWYLWTGKHSQADDFYLPWHTQHLYKQWPEITPYLALPPGWGFVVAPDYEDVWFDPDLLG